MQAIKLFSAKHTCKKKSAILHNEYLSGHPLTPPQGAVYTIQWSDCKHGAKQFWHSLRLPDLFLCCCCFFFLKKWCSLRWKKRNVSNQLDKQCGNIDKTQQFNHSTIKTGHCVYSASVSHYPRLVKVRFITLKLHEVYGCFWHEDRLTFKFLSISALRTSGLLPADALLSPNKNCTVILFFSLLWQKKKMERVIAGHGWKQSELCACMWDAPCWGECHTELKHEGRAKDTPFNHNVTISCTWLWCKDSPNVLAVGSWRGENGCTHGPLTSHGHMRRV